MIDLIPRPINPRKLAWLAITLRECKLNYSRSNYHVLPLSNKDL